MKLAKSYGIALLLMMGLTLAAGTAQAGRAETILLHASKGDADKQYRAGRLYEKGKDVEQDWAEALKWYRAAAKQKLAKAEFKVGYFYSRGMGVKKDLDKAAEWYEISAKQGYATAQYHLGLLYGNMPFSEENYKKAHRWLSTANDNGFSAARYRLLDLEAEYKRKKLAAAKAEPPAPKPKAKAKPKPAAKVVKKPKPVDPVKRLRSSILAGGWNDGKEQASPYLPSAATRCKRDGGKIKCMSDPQTHVHGESDQITYELESVIEPAGKKTTKIKYRRNVLNVEGADGGAPELPVKTGWQLSSRSMQCTLSAPDTIDCKKGRGGKMSFQRVGQVAAQQQP